MAEVDAREASTDVRFASSVSEITAALGNLPWGSEAPAQCSHKLGASRLFVIAEQRQCMRRRHCRWRSISFHDGNEASSVRSGLILERGEFSVSVYELVSTWFGSTVLETIPHPVIARGAACIEPCAVLDVRHPATPGAFRERVRVLTAGPL
jgi:hypothetical protein